MIKINTNKTAKERAIRTIDEDLKEADTQLMK